MKLGFGSRTWSIVLVTLKYPCAVLNPICSSSGKSEAGAAFVLIWWREDRQYHIVEEIFRVHLQQCSPKKEMCGNIKDRQINSFLHISSLPLAGYRNWHHGLGTRIIQNTSCNVGWWNCFSELYISYLLLLPPNVSETTTQPLLHRISQDCHLSDLRKSGLNYMGFLCFNYLGVVGKPWFHFNWLKKLG